MKSIFITGTGTEVGKTAVTAGLALLANSMGITTSIMKPVQTGSDDYPPDIEVINCIAKGLKRLPKKLEQPYIFPFAASPHLAAEKEDIVIDPLKLVSAYKQINDTEETDLLLVEGAGGLYVPIRDDYFMIDLIEKLKIATILVTLPGLGTLNHTLLSLRALESRNIPVSAIVINMCSNNPDKIEKDNYKTIQRYAGKIPVIQIKFVKDFPKVNDSDIDNNFIDNLLANFTNENSKQILSN